MYFAVVFIVSRIIIRNYFLSRDKAINFHNLQLTSRVHAGGRREKSEREGGENSIYFEENFIVSSSSPRDEMVCSIHGK